MTVIKSNETSLTTVLGEDVLQGNFTVPKTGSLSIEIKDGVLIKAEVRNS